MMGNEFLDRLQNRIKKSREKQSIGDWICSNTTLTSGVPFSFKRHKFQEEIVCDEHPEIYVQKLSQMGLTECAIRRNIQFIATHPGTTALYAFPDGLMRKKQMQTRIMPIFSRDFPVPKNSDWIRNNEILQLGDSFLIVTGNTEGESTGTQADITTLDEYDLSDELFLSLVRSRTQHSQYRYRFGLSTPTFRNAGIDKDYSISDQREFFTKCVHCGCWNLPLYTRDWVVIPGLPDGVECLVEDITPDILSKLDLDNAYVKCKKCGKPLVLGDDAEHAWVATYPDRINVRGYQVRPFSSDLLSIRYLVTTCADYKKRDQVRRAWNTVIGLPYESSTTRLQQSDIMVCMGDDRVEPPSDDRKYFIGIDVGITCHATIVDDANKAVFFEQINFENLVNRVRELNNIYKFKGGAIDRKPQIILSNMVRDDNDGKIMPCDYHDGRNVEAHKDELGNIDYYKINRTNALDYVRDLVVTHRLKITGYRHQQNTIVEHLRSMWRDDGLETESKTPRWKKLSDTDHYFHSIGLALHSMKIYDYINSSSSSDDRFCLGISGPASSILDSQNKTLYNENLLQYSKDIQKHKVKRLR